MDPALRAAATGMMAQQTRTEVIANNLANVNTVGFKASRATFKDQLQQNYSGGAASGLALRILEAGFQLKMPRMFAALLLISLTGVCIFLVMSLISHLMLRSWHESAIKRES